VVDATGEAFEALPDGGGQSSTEVVVGVVVVNKTWLGTAFGEGIDDATVYPVLIGFYTVESRNCGFLQFIAFLDLNV
jgi:hypothetical protein